MPNCAVATDSVRLAPAVSLLDATFNGLRWRDAPAYISVQIAGCALGAILANAMFAKAAVGISTDHRAGPAHLLGDVVATLGLLMVILALARTRRLVTIPAAVGAYIAAGYFFTSFANPAIAIGRTLADTFAGIASASVPRFTLAQLIGTAIAVATIRPLYPDIRPADAAAVPLPHRS